MKLQLLFTKGGLQYQILRSRTVQEENSFFVTDETSPDFIAEKLTEILTKPDLREVARSPLPLRRHTAQRSEPA